MRFRILQALSALLFIFTTSQSSATNGDSPCNAILVSSNGNSGPYSNTGFLSVAPNPSCFGGGAKNYFWFTFIASSPSVTVKVNGATILKSMVALYSASSCTGTFTQLACGNSNNINSTLNYSSLSIGTCYYIIVDGNLNNVGTFSLVLNSPTQPSNDLACNAFSIPTPEFCSSSEAFSTVGATPETAAQSGTCFDLTGAVNGVWFKFVANAACASVTISGGGANGMKRPQVAFLQAVGGLCTAANFSSLASGCSQAPVAKSFVTANVSALAIGQTYYILVDDYGSNTGTFKICFSNKACAAATPINDDCASAIPLCPGQNFIGTTIGSSGNSLQDPAAALWSCSSTASLNKTLYFTFSTSNTNDPVVIDILPNCTGSNVPLMAGIFLAIGPPCVAANWSSPMVCASGSVTNINAGFTINTSTALSPNTTYYLVLDVPDPIQCGFSLNISGNKGTYAGADEIVCINAAAQVLLGASPAGGSWTGDGISGASFDPLTVGLGNHTLIYSANGCADTKLLQVSGPQVSASTCNNSTLCEGDSMRLKGNIVSPVSSYPISFASSNGPITIPDNDLTGVSSAISVSGISGVLGTASITSVCINIAHSWDFDLLIQLQSPSGSAITLASGQGGDEDNYFNTCFSSSATQTIIGAPPSFNGSYLPQQAFSALNGIINGNWELIVKDTRSSDIGQLLNWSITFNKADSISTYSWSPAGSIKNYANSLSPMINPPSTTNYILSATDVFGCTNSSQLTVNVNPRPHAGPDVSLCSGVNGNITVSSVPGYTYAWSPVSGTNGITSGSSTPSPTLNIVWNGPGIKKQKYKVLCTAPPGSCTVTDTVEVTISPKPTLSTPNAVKKLCDDGSSTYGVTATLTGTPPWTIKHCLNGVPDSTITTHTTPYVFLTKSAGVHSFCYVSDSSGCIGTCTGSATVSLVPEISVSNITRTCNAGQTLYSVQFDISGGDATSLLVTPGPAPSCPIAPCPPNNRHYASNLLAAGNPYNVLISDAVCVHTENVTGNFTCNCAASAAIEGDTTICPGGTANLRVKLTGTGPWTIKYNLGGVLQPTVFFAGPGNIYTFTTNTAGVYTMQTINDLNCAGSTSGSATVVIHSQPTATMSASKTSICQGDSSLICINFTGTSPFHYQYTGSGPLSLLPVGNSICFYTKTNTALVPVFANDNYCVATLSGNANVVVHPTPTVQLSCTNDTICAGATTGINFAFTPVPTALQPTTMNWFNGSANVPLAVTATPKNISPVSGGTYYSNLITDAFGCTSSLSDTVEIVELSVPTAVLTLLSNDSICAGSFATFQISVSGIGPWSVKYHRPIGLDTTVIFSLSPYIFQTSTSGVYNLVQVKDNVTSCIGTVSGSATIVVNPLPAAVVSGGGTACAGTNVPVNITLTGTSPWSLIYQDNGASNVMLNNQVAPSFVLNYSNISNFDFNILNIEDAHHCSNSSTNGVHVTIHPLPTATVIGGDSLCDGTTAFVTINFTGARPFDFTYDSLPGKSRTVTGYDSTIFTIPVQAIGTWIYKLSTVTDINNCTNSGTGIARIVIHPNPTAILSIAQANYCSGATAAVTVNLTGTAPWTFNYNNPTLVVNPATNNNPFLVNETATGTYSYFLNSTVSDKNGCSSLGAGTANFTIHALPTAIVSGTDSACFGTTKNVSIQLSGTAPWYITYDSLSSGSTVTVKRYNTPVLIPVSAIGNWSYSVTQIADSFCTNLGSGNANIKIWALPTATMTGGGKICTGQKDTLLVICNGQGPFNFKIRNSTTNTDTVINNYSGPFPFIYYTYGAGNFVLTNLSDKKCAGTCNDTVSVIYTARPSAQFSAQNVCNGQLMSFSNSSITAGPIPPIWKWNFGEIIPSFSSVHSPTHLYSSAQGYSVTLTVDVNGCRDSISKIVYVNPLPNPSFTSLPNTPALVNQVVSLTNNSTISSGNIASYIWDLGDGTLPTSTNVSHAYSGCNTYSVSLTATSDSGCFASTTQTVNVGEAPKADFTTLPVCLGFPTTFNNLSTIAPCNISSTITGYQWNFGVFPGTNSTSVSPSYVYPSPGTFSVKLIVTSNYGFADTIIKSVTVYDKPNANFLLSNVCSGGTTLFSDLSTSPDPLTYSWSSLPAGFTSNLTSPTTVFPTAGIYAVQLIIETNHTCKDTISQPAEVYPNPVADFTFPDFCVQLPGLFTNTSNITIGTLTYVWDFGDASGFSAIQNPTHSYLNAGPVMVLLTAKSNHNCIDTTAKSVLIKSIPTTDFTQDVTVGCAPLCVQFTNQTVNQNGPITGYSWDFGDAQTSTDTDPQHCYALAGTYTVKLKASSNSSCADEEIKTNLIVVHPVPVADFSYSPDPATTFTSEIHFKNETTGATQWQWDFDHDLATSSEANPVYFYPSDTAVYLVQLIAINSDNCSASVTKPVVIEKDFSFYAPNSFTPNGDGNNETFRIFGDGIQDFEINIFDRNGHPVYRSTNYKEGWNGNYFNIGYVMKEEVYVYNVTIVDAFGKSHSYKGSITLIR